jgi:hypothetical protein
MLPWESRHRDRALDAFRRLQLDVEAVCAHLAESCPSRLDTLILGFVTSATYYARFRVPSLAILSPQLIVTGAYVMRCIGPSPGFCRACCDGQVPNWLTSRLVAARHRLTRGALFCSPHIDRNVPIAPTAGQHLSGVEQRTGTCFPSAV